MFGGFNFRVRVKCRVFRVSASGFLPGLGLLRFQGEGRESPSLAASDCFGKPDMGVCVVFWRTPTPKKCIYIYVYMYICVWSCDFGFPFNPPNKGISKTGRLK